jgi:uncharacterized protein (TIGR00299 family) protein
MSRHLHLECHSGAAGDMFLGLMLDLGASREEIETALASLPLPGWRLEVERAESAGLGGTRVRVLLEAEEPARRLADIEAVLGGGELPEPVRRRALRTLRRLVEVEAELHGMPLEKAHLHEVGATDALVDVTGTLLGAHLLGVESASASAPLPLGGGTVECSHGHYPVPAPATARLLEGAPVVGGPVDQELITPTGAALLVELVERFGPAPAGRLLASGYGAGTRRIPGRPNMLRGLLLDPAVEEGGLVAVVETAVDEMNPQDLEPLRERLEEAGALDLMAQQVLMKKGRPGQLLTAICRPGRREAVVEALVAHSPTLGVRWRLEERRELTREILEVDTPYGKVRVKRAERGPAGTTLQPEFEDCRRLAGEAGVSVEEVRRTALLAARDAR